MYRKRKKQISVLCLAIGMTLAGCSATDNQSPATDNQNPEPASAPASAESAFSLEEVTVITEALDNRRKPSAVALRYSAIVDPESLSTDDYQVEGHTVANIYTNSTAAKSDAGAEGNYVILEFAYENTDVPSADMGGARNPGDAAERPAPPEGSGPPDGSGPPEGRTPPDGSGSPEGRTPPDGSGPPDGLTPPDGSDPPEGSGRNAVAEPPFMDVSVIQSGDISSIDGAVCAASASAVVNSARIDLDDNGSL